MATEQPRAVWCCSSCGAIYHKDYPRCPADGAEVVMSERDPLLGSAVGHYTIDALLGEGGMGRVYLAHHAHLPNKRYAIKVLLGDHAASAAMRARFTREAERASQIDHPNVVKVVDFGQTGHGLLYIVMDYVDGPSLVTLIGDQPMAAARVIALSRAICQGLVHAHAAGIVHRDLKPENILVSTGTDGPVPRIVDFGLALSVDQSDARLTESGMTMGTPAFAAPEQLSGKPIDHRADLYALGMTMFEMLSGGRPPFDGHILEMMSARTARDVPRVSERFPELEVPYELEDIVARLTRRRPADRYDGAYEVIAALDALRLVGEPATPTEQIAQRRSRRRWLAAAVLAAGAGGAALWFAVGADRPVAVALAEEDRAPAAPPPAAGSPAGAAAPAAGDPGSLAGAAAEVSSGAAPAAGDPAPAIAEDPAASPTAAPPVRQRHRPRAGRPTGHAVAAAAPSGAPAAPSSPSSVEARRVALAAASDPPGAPPAAQLAASPPGPAPARALRATIDSVDVSGSLPRGDVQRAVERRWSAIARCLPAAPETVTAHFTIGEARRAQGVRATGAAPQINACITAALADVRTEAAPDVGDVEVTVRIAFAVKT